MNLFKTIAAILAAKGDSVNITIQKRNDESLLVVAVSYNAPGVKDEAKELIAPFTLKGTADELDEAFVEQIATPLASSSGLLTSIAEFEKSVKTASANSKKAEADKKEADKKAEKEKKEAEKAAEKEKKEAEKKAEKERKEAEKAEEKARKEAEKAAARKPSIVDSEGDLFKEEHATFENAQVEEEEAVPAPVVETHAEEQAPEPEAAAEVEDIPAAIAPRPLSVLWPLVKQTRNAGQYDEALTLLEECKLSAESPKQLETICANIEFCNAHLGRVSA